MNNGQINETPERRTTVLVSTKSKGQVNEAPVRTTTALRHLKLIAIASNISILLCLIILIATPDSNGYEPVIYDVYPSVFWFLLALPFFLLFVYALYVQTAEGKAVKKHGLLTLSLIFSVAIASTIITLLPLIRGYAFYNPGDSLSHLGYVKDILASGHFGRSNVYPITHILIVDINFVTSIGVKEAMMLVPPAFTLVFSAFMYLVTKTIWRSGPMALMIVTLSLLPFLGTDTTFLLPNVAAFLMVPLILFELVMAWTSTGHDKLAHYALLVVLLVVLPMFHPETSLFLLIVLITFALAARIIKRWPRFFSTSRGEFFLSKPRLAIPIAVLSAILFAWFSASIYFEGIVRTVVKAVTFSSSGSPLDSYSSILNYVQVQLSDILQTALLLYGTPLLLAMILVYEFVKLAGIRKGETLKVDEFVLSAMVFVFAVMAFIFFIVDLIIGPRPIKYMIMFAFFLFALLAQRSIGRFRRSRIRSSIFQSAVLVIVACLVIISISAVYPSPKINHLNYQVTDNDLTGMNYFLQYGNEENRVYAITLLAQRYVNALMGIDATSRYISDLSPPPHFAYDSSKDNAAATPQQRFYMIFDERTEIFYEIVYPNYSTYWKYNENDFRRLDHDPSVGTIYANGGLKIFEVHGEF